MQVAKTGARLTLSFSGMESRFLLRTLGQIIANYQLSERLEKHVDRLGNKIAPGAFGKDQ